MNEIFSNLSSISWWFGVIFVGILVSLGGSYLKPYTDEWLAKHSKSRKNKNDEEREKWANEVLRLQCDENYRILFISRISHARGRSILFIILGTALPLLCTLISVSAQFILITSPKNLNLTSVFYNSADETLIFFILLTLVTIFFGLISVMLGVLYFKNVERLQQQLEESFMEIFDEKSELDN